jgi:hypothetical protein
VCASTGWLVIGQDLVMPRTNPKSTDTVAGRSWHDYHHVIGKELLQHCRLIFFVGSKKKQIRVNDVEVKAVGDLLANNFRDSEKNCIFTTRKILHSGKYFAFRIVIFF